MLHVTINRIQITKPDKWIFKQMNKKLSGQEYKY